MLDGGVAGMFVGGVAGMLGGAAAPGVAASPGWFAGAVAELSTALPIGADPLR